MIKIKNETLKNGFTLPKIGFGTWQMGQRTTYGPAQDVQDNLKVIRSAVEMGVVHIDTAELYGDGYVEEMIAKTLVGIDRSKYFLTSKVRGQNATKKGIIKAIEGSLKRLNTDYLDLYLIHWRTDGVEIEEGILALNDLVDRGLIKNFGVSNYAVPSLQKALAVARHPIVVNQVQYNLQHREAEGNGVLGFCQKNDIILEAWGPVRPVNSNTIDILIVGEMCEKYNLTPHQLAISWLISQQNVTTLFKTSSVEHFQENIKVAEMVLEPGDIEKLRDEFPGQEFVSDFAMR